MNLVIPGVEYARLLSFFFLFAYLLTLLHCRNYFLPASSQCEVCTLYTEFTQRTSVHDRWYWLRKSSFQFKFHHSIYGALKKRLIFPILSEANASYMRAKYDSVIPNFATDWNSHITPDRGRLLFEKE